jgi:preprotein translocase subunit SecE
MTNPAVETVNSAADKVRWALAALLIIGGIAAFYLLGKESAWLRVLAMLGLFAAGIGVFFTSVAGRELIGFFRESTRETRKVVWPSRKETMQTTGFVFLFAVIMAIFLWGTDKTVEWVLYDLLLSGTR